MKIGKVWLSTLMVSGFLVCFALSTTHAEEYPELDRWANQWFSITASASGWEIEGGSTTISILKGSMKGYLKLESLAADGGSLEAFLYGPNLNEELVLLATGSCDYVRGSDWDFICKLYQGGISPFDAEFDTFIRITGKQNTKTVPISLKSATLKSSGGILVGHVDEEFPDTLTVGGITLSGKWLDLTTFCKSTKNQGTPPYADCP